jgi:hypothetical protein
MHRVSADVLLTARRAQAVPRTKTQPKRFAILEERMVVFSRCQLMGNL